MAGTYNIVADQGATFNLNFTIKIDEVPWNLDSYKVRMQVRSDINTAAKLLDLSKDNGKMTANAIGQVTATASATEMTGVPSGRHMYDIEVESTGGEVTRILEGRFAVSAEVTR